MEGAWGIWDCEGTLQGRILVFEDFPEETGTSVVFALLEGDEKYCFDFAQE